MDRVFFFLKAKQKVDVGDNPAPVEASKRLVRKYEPDWNLDLLRKAVTLRWKQFVERDEILSQPCLFVFYLFVMFVFFSLYLGKWSYC